MKKRTLAIMLIFALIAAFCFAGCGSSAGSSSSGNKSVVIRMNEKYISSEATRNEESTYIIFYSNGTGKYRRYRYYRSVFNDKEEIVDYTITFKYTYVDKDKEAVATFYDSVQFSEKHNEPVNSVESWTQIFTLSENVIMSSGGSVYINEKYLNNELKNFDIIQENTI